MPFIVRKEDRVPGPGTDTTTREWVIAPNRLEDDRLTLELVHLAPGAELALGTAADELAWFQLLAGRVSMDGEATDVDWVCMLAGGRGATLVAEEGSDLMVARVPHAAEYDPAVRDGLVRRVDWSTEPVLESEHDSRRRIYLASTGLWGTEAVKGEMIVYPPGAAGAAHHHEGAEHFQFVVSGAGTAVLEGEEVEIGMGDLLYNLEHEVHWFANRHDKDFIFVEFFVPGQNRTVWVPGVNVCGWNPTTSDVKGRPAARTLAYHVHGQGDV